MRPFLFISRDYKTATFRSDRTFILIILDLFMRVYLLFFLLLNAITVAQPVSIEEAEHQRFDYFKNQLRRLNYYVEEVFCLNGLFNAENALSVNTQNEKQTLYTRYLFKLSQRFAALGLNPADFFCKVEPAYPTIHKRHQAPRKRTKLSRYRVMDYLYRVLEEENVFGVL